MSHKEDMPKPQRLRYDENAGSTQKGHSSRCSQCINEGSFQDYHIKIHELFDVLCCSQPDHPSTCSCLLLVILTVSDSYGDLEEEHGTYVELRIFTSKNYGAKREYITCKSFNT